MRKQTRIHDRSDLPGRPIESEEARCREGSLPSVAPLANPFVPFQRMEPPTYEVRKAIVRGTMFPGLDLPYRGMVNEGTLTRTPIHELQTLSFAITDLGEYLDTHSNDRAMFDLFRSYVEMYEECKERYESIHGPLTMKGTAYRDCYDWIKSPWPWEYEANMEG